ncbi:MAG: hypothetical protein KQA34_01050 [Candidatus Aenigmarchaeota archaeon]|nr:hypothetical protein [Candidatus Aenigmarchaeota archaeon]
MNLPSKVIKRENYLQDFKIEKIENAIKKALIASNKFEENLLKNLLNQVLNKISQKFKDKYPHVEEIQDIIEQVLIENNLYETAKAFILYRKEREKIREEKKKILNKEFLDEIDRRFSINALRVVASRYLLRDENGKIIETPKQLFERVVALIVILDILYDEKFLIKMVNKKFMKMKALYDYELEIQLKERGLYKEEVIKKISESGSIQNIEEIPNDMKEYFVTVYEISWQDHLRAQYEFSFWVDNGISKTINMPFETSWKDILNAFYFAYKLGLKGITIFRECSKLPVYKFKHSIKKIFYNEKTLEMLKSFSVEVKSLEEKDFSKKIENKIFRCPNCGSNLIVFRENCLNCLECGWNTCLLG